MGQAGQSAGFSKPVMEAMEDVSTVLKRIYLV
uniref:Uncharacterized protein n=1 Tax=Physcomitrium patens TaxID=3218 RepID=A0A2K1J1D5_PHYPA|nr:hypothetical protein PHYPA_023225 [Physcomitrium patens]